jgi:phosphoribosylpyrophosphate synthetase
MISSDDLVVVSPDVGGVARARAFAKKLSDAPLAIVDKRRHGHNLSEVSCFLLHFSSRHYGKFQCQKKKKAIIICFKGFACDFAGNESYWGC